MNENNDFKLKDHLIIDFREGKRYGVETATKYLIFFWGQMW